MRAPLLQVDEVDLFYGDAQALAGVSLEVAAGEIVTIVGANGAGKSSLIRAIHGIEKPAHGSVRFDGIDVTGWSSHRTCEAGIGHVAEGRQVFPNLTVMENLEMGATPRRARSTTTRSSACGRTASTCRRTCSATPPAVRTKASTCGRSTSSRCTPARRARR